MKGKPGGNSNITINARGKPNNLNHTLGQGQVDQTIGDKGPQPEPVSTVHKT